MWLTDNYWLELALAAALGLGLVANVLAVSCYLRWRQQAARSERLQQQLEHSLQLLSSSSIGMGRKLRHLERQALGEQAEPPLLQPENALARHAPASSPAPAAAKAPSMTASMPLRDATLQDAAALLAAGVAPEEVARRCGISRAEAGLMKLMHAQVSPATAA